MSKKGAYGLIVAGIVAVLIAAYAAAASRQSRPNIVLVTMDALRPDHLGCYGYSRRTSPFLDSVAGQGIVFLNAVSQSNCTGPAIPSILTGRFPSQHKVFDFGESLPQDMPTIATELEKRGYLLGFFTDNIGATKLLGLDRAFDTFTGVATLEVDYRDDGKARVRKIGDLDSIIFRWLRKHRGRPFFLWVHYLEPHRPYLIPPEITRPFLDDPAGKTRAPVPAVADPEYGLGGLPARLVQQEGGNTDLNHYIALYDASIRYADTRLESLWQELRRLGLDSNTILIVSADHGESLGEHGLYFTHGFQLYDPLVRIPMVMRLPNAAHKGARVIAQVSQIDIAPTILEAAGAPVPPGMPGQSLARALDSVEGRTPYAFSLFSDGESVRTLGWKLIYNRGAGTYELYDLANDPGETRNVINERAEKAEELLRVLKPFIDEGAPREKKPAGLTQQEKEQLRQLGYVQ